MPIDPYPPETFGFIAQVEQAYASLMQSAPARGEESLGGKLLYAGELSSEGRALLVAANIAGAASLAASADAAALRQAQRDGVIDFLVNALDEALRILKNEIRKRQPVAVGVSVAPQAIVKEMLDRGVLPDLLPPPLKTSSSPPEFAAFVAQGARRVEAPPQRPGSKLLIWPIPAEFAHRPAEFDAVLLEYLPPGDHAIRRWLRLSPRYLGPQFRRLRSLRCNEETASRLIDVVGQPLHP
jgi:hypothetical protein